MNTTMNFASHSNNASTSIASGIGAGLAISFLDGIMAQNIDYSVVFPSMKIIDKNQINHTFNYLKWGSFIMIELKKV